MSARRGENVERDYEKESERERERSERVKEGIERNSFVNIQFSHGSFGYLLGRQREGLSRGDYAAILWRLVVGITPCASIINLVS